MSALPHPRLQPRIEPPVLATAAGELDGPLQGLAAQLLRQCTASSSPHLMLVGVDAGAGCSTVAAHATRQLAPGHGGATWVRVDDTATADFDPQVPPHADTQGVRRTRMRIADCMALFRSPQGGMPPRWLQAEPLVLWDLPPISRSPAALLMAPHSQGVILVARAGHTRKAVLRHTARQFEQAGTQVLGVVLNRTHNWIPEWLYRLI